MTNPKILAKHYHFNSTVHSKSTGPPPPVCSHLPWCRQRRVQCAPNFQKLENLDSENHQIFSIVQFRWRYKVNLYRAYDCVVKKEKSHWPWTISKDITKEMWTKKNSEMKTREQFCQIVAVEFIECVCRFHLRLLKLQCERRELLPVLRFTLPTVHRGSLLTHFPPPLFQFGVSECEFWL